MAIWVWGRDLENDQNCFYTQPSAVEEAGRTALDVPSGMTAARDLITGRDTGLGFTLDPMTPLLLELH